MVLTNAASDFFSHFGVGTLMALSLVRETELKRSFYLFTSTVCAVFIALSLFLGDGSASAGYLLLSLPCAVGFYASYAMEWRRTARVALFGAVIFGIAGVSGDLAHAAADLVCSPLQRLLLMLNLMASLALSGIVLATLILGHWYLISPRLSFKPLVRGALLFFAAVCFRAAILGAILLVFGGAAGLEGKLFLNRLLSWNEFGMFFLLRIFWGILGPLVLSILVYKTAAMQSNQSATGILYVALVFVLIGELITHYLWALARIPL